jgi:autophagy-related protein 5
VPLKWHVPIGLLYDLYASPSSPSPSITTNHDPHNRQLPFRLVCHFSDYPSDQLVLLDEELKALHDAFINSVKEADFVRNGTAKGIMSLSKEDSTGLWDAVRQRTYTTSSSPIKPWTRLKPSGYLD